MESELCNIYFNWILSIRSTPGEVKALLDNSFSLIKVRKSDFICVYEHVCSLLIRHFDYCNSKIIRRESIYFFHTVELYQIVIYFWFQAPNSSYALGLLALLFYGSLSPRLSTAICLFEVVVHDPVFMDLVSQSPLAGAAAAASQSSSIFMLLSTISFFRAVSLSFPPPQLLLPCVVAFTTCYLAGISLLLSSGAHWASEMPPGIQ